MYSLQNEKKIAVELIVDQCNPVISSNVNNVALCSWQTLLALNAPFSLREEILR